VEITKPEITLIVMILLVVSIFVFIGYWWVGIIAFAILYHTFMYVRNYKIRPSNKNNIIGE